MRTALGVILLVELVERAVGRNVSKENPNRSLVRKWMSLLLEKLLQFRNGLVALLVRRALRFLGTGQRIGLVVDWRRIVGSLLGLVEQPFIDAITNAGEFLQMGFAEDRQAIFVQIVAIDP